MVQLALGYPDREAGNRHYVAPTRLSLVLDVESRHRSGRPRRRSLIREMATTKHDL
jgi:hypothetical protein